MGSTIGYSRFHTEMRSFGRRTGRFRVGVSAKMKLQNWQTVGSVCVVGMVSHMLFHLVVGSSRFRVGGSREMKH